MFKEIRKLMLYFVLISILLSFFVAFMFYFAGFVTGETIKGVHINIYPDVCSKDNDLPAINNLDDKGFKIPYTNKTCTKPFKDINGFWLCNIDDIVGG